MPQRAQRPSHVCARRSCPQHTFTACSTYLIVLILSFYCHILWLLVNSARSLWSISVMLSSRTALPNLGLAAFNSHNECF